jgi:hypothetical protein
VRSVPRWTECCRGNDRQERLLEVHLRSAGPHSVERNYPRGDSHSAPCRFIYEQPYYADLADTEAINDDLLTQVSHTCEPMKSCPFANLPMGKHGGGNEGVSKEGMKTMTRVAPQLVVQVAFVEWTDYGLCSGTRRTWPS